MIIQLETEMSVLGCHGFRFWTDTTALACNANLSSVLATYCSKRAFSVCNEAVKNLRCVLLRCLV